jgi:hypothetical protein
MKAKGQIHSSPGFFVTEKGFVEGKNKFNRQLMVFSSLYGVSHTYGKILR